MKTVFLIVMLAVLAMWIYRLYEALTSKRKNHYLAPGMYPPVPKDVPLVSILIPARNEERNIGKCVESLCGLDYPNYEVFVVDDRSTDRTAQIVEEFTHKDPRIHLVRNQELHEGWTGKNFALFKGQSLAKGRWLLFSDADTVHAPQSLSQAIQLAKNKKLDMITLLPSLTGETFWEKLLQPIAGAILMIYFPIQKANDPASPVAFANGQYILIKREMYERLGTHENLRSYFLEDIAMAKAVKALKGRMLVVPAPTLYETRMYKDFTEIWNGWSRIYFYIFEKHFLRLLSTIFGVFVVSLLPVFALLFLLCWWLIATELSHYTWTIFALSILQVVLMRLAVFRYYTLSGCNPYYSILNPVGCCIIIGILADSIWKIFSKKGMTWRGTTYAK